MKGVTNHDYVDEIRQKEHRHIRIFSGNAGVFHVRNSAVG